MKHLAGRRILLVMSTAVLLCAAAVVFLFLHFGQNDDRAIRNFNGAYAAYDGAMVEASNLAAPEDPAAHALASLKQASMARISSLTRHDGDLMRSMSAVADASAKELDGLSAYRAALADGDPAAGQLAGVLAEETRQRKEAYAVFIQWLGK